MTNSNFTDNSATFGGGFVIYRGCPPGAVASCVNIASGCTFTSNAASDSGGGLYITKSDKVYVSDSALSGMQQDGNPMQCSLARKVTCDWLG